MPRTIEKTIFKFDELSARAKERARDWFRSCDDFDAECVTEDFATICDLLGVDIRQKPVTLMSGKTRFDPDVSYYGFGHQGQGAAFSASYRYKAGSVKAVKEYAPQDTVLVRIADDLYQAQRKAFYRLEASVTKSGRDGLSQRVDVTNSHTGDDATEAQCDVITEAMLDLAHWLFLQLRNEYEYRNSDEHVDESIRINEYEFDENGEPV